MNDRLSAIMERAERLDALDTEVEGFVIGSFSNFIEEMLCNFESALDEMEAENE
ncbi:MAG: hypothetical protein FWG43_05995 [Clostridiales bacterium]|nr:hypothetical protein [Clostridiales bacterium]